MGLYALALAATLAMASLNAANTFTLISGGTSNQFGATFQEMSADGSRVYFLTYEALTAGDTDAALDVYRRAGGVLTLMSPGTANLEASMLTTMADGGVLFQTTESLLSEDGDSELDIYRSVDGAVTLVTPGTTLPVAFKRTYGAKVFFHTQESLSPSDGDSVQDVYAWSAGTISLVSVNTPTEAAYVPDGLPNTLSNTVATIDGSAIILMTNEGIDASDVDGDQDAYLFGSGGETLLTGGTEHMFAAFLGASADLSRVFFRTSESLDSGDIDGVTDVYQSMGGQITLLSGTTDDASVEFLDASLDGVAVILRASLLPLAAGGATNATDIYRASGGAITLVSGTGSAPVLFGGISADGSRVFFHSYDVLSAADVDSSFDVYEGLGGSLTLLSGGGPTCTVPVNMGGCDVFFVNASYDGTKVIFLSFESLVAADTDNNQRDVYMASGGVLTLRSPDGSVGGAQLGALGTPNLSVVALITSDSLDPADLDSGAIDIYTSVESTGPPPTDSVAPTVSCVSADGAWHAANVTLGCTASDSGSGLANAADASFTLSTTVALGDELANAFTDSREVCDVAGNCATAQVGGNRIDRRQPTVTCPAADGVWYANNVTLACTASDGGSGLASGADASFNLSTSVSAGTEDANAFTNSRNVCDAVSNCRSVSVGGNQIDRRAPSITVSSPLSGAQFTVGQNVASSYSCSDAGSGLLSCVGPVASGQLLDTATPGSKTFTVTGTDNVGNSTSTEVSYSVVSGGGGGGFSFGGFQQPIDPFPTLNSMRGGGAVPVKFSLGGPQGLAIFATGYPKSQTTLCSSTTPEDGVEQVITAGNSSLSYDAATDTYSYIWKTEKSWAGTCRQLVMQFIDGSVQRANFKFR
jgi:hypothetical protein